MGLTCTDDYKFLLEEMIILNEVIFNKNQKIQIASSSTSSKIRIKIFEKGKIMIEVNEDEAHSVGAQTKNFIEKNPTLFKKI